ncbi:MAG: adenosylcobinamide-GDP ribazoletransferase [Pseudomonadota bacterium]
MKDFIFAAVFAFQFLTRIPVPVLIEPREPIVRKALICFPLVGWVLGLILYAVWWLLNATGKCSPVTIAVLLVTIETLLTGAFHLDGLADTFDAFLSSGKSREEKLAIMKDSRIGVMGAVALTLTLVLKITLLNELLEHTLPAAILIYPAIGRWAQVALYVFSPYARERGLGLIFSSAANKKALVYATLILLPCFTLPISLPATFLAAAYLWVFRGYVHKQINGITGDVLGASTVLSEIMFLLGIVIFS